MRYENAVVVLGMFDGIHKGHRALFHEAVKMARVIDGSPYVFTFFNHPRTTFGQSPQVLTTAPERQKIIKSLGLKAIMIPFTQELSHKTAKAFWDYIKSVFDLKGIVVGFDYRFGFEGKGSRAYLEKWCKEDGIGLNVIEPVLYKGEKISSSRIRACLRQGELDEANTMLVDPYSFSNIITPHAQIGRKLGFPTANVIPGDKVIPRHGVYITEFLVERKHYSSITNIGVRPTVESAGEVIIETHVLGDCGDLYGKKAKVILRKFLRDEKQFESFEGLQEQIKEDCQKALQFHIAQSNRH